MSVTSRWVDSFGGMVRAKVLVERGVARGGLVRAGVRGGGSREAACMGGAEEEGSRGVRLTYPRVRQCSPVESLGGPRAILFGRM